MLNAAFVLAACTGSISSFSASCEAKNAEVLLAKAPETLLQEPVPVVDNRPFLVFIHSKGCPVCAKVRPIMEQLRTTYDGKMRFIFLDVTDEHSKDSARAEAKAKGVSAFFALYEDTFPCVGIFNSKKKCVKELYGFQTKEKYVATIEKALSAR